MTSLVIDIGNTFTKIAVFKLDELLVVRQFETVDMPALNDFITNYKPENAIISSVKKDKEPWQAGLEQKCRLLISVH